MIRRKGIPDGGCSMCCRLKEKLEYLWDHTMGAIKKVNEITPDGDGKFTIEAGSNIEITSVENGLKLDTTGGVSYYSSGDQYVNVDNTDLKITVNAGSAGGLAVHDDLETVAQGVSAVNSRVDQIVDGDLQVGYARNAGQANTAASAQTATNATNATNAANLGSASSNVGNDTRPVKIVNGKAVAVTNPFERKIEAINRAHITFTTLNINIANSWVNQTGTVSIPTGSPYFANTSGRIQILESGLYLITARLANDLSQYEAISINGANIFQNVVHNTQIVNTVFLSANDTIQCALYGSTTGSGYFENYDGLNNLEIIKL